MIKNICGKEYFAVEVICHTALTKTEEKTVKTEAQRARSEAMKNGYNIDTMQRMTEHGKQYYTFTK